MIDLANHQLIRLGEVPEHLPPAPGKRRMHPSTPFRWATRGIRAADGTTVLLETVKVGGALYTSREALQAFAERLSPAAACSSPAVTGITRRASTAAARECDSLGL